MDIETLLRESNPALEIEVAGPDSAVGRSIRDDVTSRRTASMDRQSTRPWVLRTVRVRVAAAVAVAAVIVLLVVILPSTVGPSSSSAAGTFTRLASAAAKATSLEPGQYYYTDIERQTYVIGVGSSSTAPAFDEYLLGTVQTWVAADGSGRQVTTTDPTPRFFTPADQRAWVEAGKPPAAVPPSELTTVQEFGPGSASEVNGPIPLYDVSKLPTDPSALVKVLGNENPSSTSLGTLPAGISALDFVSQCNTKACSLFERAVALLQGPDIGATPAFRAALFKVLATVPGVQLLGKTTDRAGQSGVGLQLVERSSAGTTTVICENGTATEKRSGNNMIITPGPGTQSPRMTITYRYPASATTFTIVVDPKTTTLLSSEDSFTRSVRVVPVDPCGAVQQPPQATAQTPTWTIVLGAGVVDSERAVGVVNSETAVPHAARS